VPAGFLTRRGRRPWIGDTITFSEQKFTKSAGGSSCLASANFSATFGPVKDTSVTGSPKVFVN